MSNRIVVVSPYGREYGPPRTLEHVARGLRIGGYEPICVVPPGAKITPALAALEPTIIELAGLTTVPRTLDPRRLATFTRRHLRAAEDIAAIVRDQGANAVYSSSEAIFCGGLAARRTDVRSIVHVIGMSIANPRWGAAAYIRLLASTTDAFIACSSAVAEMLAAEGVDDERIRVVHNGIEIDDLDSALALAEPTPLEISVQGPKVGMFAAFDSRKGHELFVEAAAEIAAALPSTRFYLVGGVLEGQAESSAFAHRIEGLIDQFGLSRRFVRPGFVPAPEVYDWICSMDVVLVPSRTEAFAHALLEAMACRRAIVATAVEGNLDAFVDGHSGIYVRRRPDELAAAVIGLLQDDALRKRIGEAARERVELLFDVHVTLPRIGEVARDVIG